MSGIGEDPRDRELGEYWEDRFCDIARRYGWEVLPFQCENGTFTDDAGNRYICPDVWILRRDDCQYVCEIKHKYLTQHFCYGFEKYRVDSLLALEANYSNQFGRVEALYVVHNWRKAGGKYVEENREDDWHAQLLRVCEADKIISRSRTLYKGEVTEEPVITHYYRNPFRTFEPLAHFLG